MSSLVLSDVAYAFPDTTPLFSGLDLSVGPGLTSLVGRNGAGKTTLLRLMAGRLLPTRGSVAIGGEALAGHAAIATAAATDTAAAVHPVVGYLPQQLVDAPAEHTLADQLGARPALEALARIESGRGEPADFDLVGDDWSVAERATAALDQLGLPAELGRPLGTLSGGERTLAALAGTMLARPRVLLLDEPTNNLDAHARARLFSSLDDFVSGGDCVALVVSHDLELLDRTGATVELRAGRCRVFGGPYQHYREVVEAEQAAALQSLSTARNSLRAQKRDKVDAQVVLARRARYGRKMEANKREPKIVMGQRKRAAQESAARYRATHERGVEQARERVHEADAAVRREELLRVDLPDPGLPAGRLVLDADDPVAGRIHLAGPARLRIAGRNGSGKTTLLRRLLTGCDDDEPAVLVPWTMLPQDLRVTRPDRTVVDDIWEMRPEASAEEAHAHAARFLFTGRAGARRMGDLSGGERLRAVLAARLFARPVPQLLVLDEPTNNLDLEGVEALAGALAGWRGALLLVSHDDGFCARVGVDEMVTLP